MRPYISADKGQLYDDLMPLLEAMFQEFQELSKKKPDGVLNKTKISIVNRLLEQVFKILKGEVTTGFVDMLDENNLPQNSDVALILSQAVASMVSFREKYFLFVRGNRRWITKELLDEEGIK